MLHEIRFLTVMQRETAFQILFIEKCRQIFEDIRPNNRSSWNSINPSTFPCKITRFQRIQFNF